MSQPKPNATYASRLMIVIAVLSFMGFERATATPPNQPPELALITDKNINEGSLLVFNASATDPDIPAQTLTFSLDAGAPEGAVISASGVFSWTPSEPQGPGSYTLRIIVADSGTPSLTATQAFNVTVQEINRAPTLATIPDRTINEGELLTFTATATDPDLPAQALTYSLGGGAPAGASIDPVTGVFTWTPGELQGPGTYFVSIFVTDNGTPTQNDARGFLVTVQEVNRPPELPLIADLVVNEGSFIGFSAPPTDPDIPAQTVTVTLGPGAPTGASISSGGFFIWTPSEAQGPSTNRISIIATDNGSPSLTSTQFFTAIILEVNQAPTLGFIADQIVVEEGLLTFTAVATDLDLPAQALTFTLGAGAPAGASIDPSTGVFAWTPTEAQGPANYTLSVLVTDNASPPQSTSRSFNVTVQEVNRPPSIGALEDRVVNEGSLLIFNVAATDPDIPTQTLVFTLGAGAPEGAAVSSGGLFTWTPTGSQGPSTNRITILVGDSGTPSLTATQAFTVIVADLNAAPVLATIPDQTVNEGELLTFTASATDPDQPGQTLTFSLGGGAPAGAAIDANTGVFTWTPAEAQGPATNIINVNVADSGVPPLTASRSFTVAVHEVNRAPAITAIEDRAINSGALMIFNVLASDPDLPAQTLAFSLGPGAPQGAAISASGLFTWTPTSAQSPSSNRISVIIADNGTPSLGATQQFTAIVTDLNHAPVIAVIPDQTVNEGALLTFIAGATDSDVPAQAITFSLGAGAPTGASIDSATGAFIWTPAENQGPATNVITVVATDNGTPALSAARSFQVTVQEVNRSPEIDPIAEQIVTPGTFVVFGVLFRDLDIPAQTLVATLGPGAPEGAALSAGGLFTWTPTAQSPPTNRLSAIVTDNGNPSLSATQQFTVIVVAGNHTPVISAIADQTVNEGSLLTLTAIATDSDVPAQAIAFSLGAGAPTGASIDSATGVFTWTPAENQGPATNVITIVATDNGTPALSASRSFGVVVNEVNRPPEIDPIADQVVNVGGLMVFGVPFRDPDIPTQPLAIVLGQGAPEGAAISAGGLFTWTPTAAQSPSTNRIAVIVTDNATPSLSATQHFTATVLGLNRAPTLAVIPDQSVNEGVLLSLTAAGTDPDQPLQTLTYTLGAGAADGAAINPNTGVFTWTPNELQGPASNTFTVVVTDNGTPPLNAIRSFVVAVNEVNRPPEIDPIPQQIVAPGTFVVFGVPFRDPDIPAQPLVATLGPGAPEGAALSPGGLFTWTPTAQSPITNRLAAIVTDNGNPSLSTTQQFTIIVIAGNHAPVVPAIPDQIVNEGQLLTFTASATDQDQPPQTLSYALGAGAPDGASINPITGVFTWTPSEIQGPATNIINITVTDNGTPNLSTTRSVNVMVNEVNRPPEMDPVADQTVTAGTFVVFGVGFRDLDIPFQTLTASLGAGAPEGAAISAGGLFTWTPTAAQSPSTNRIAAIVTDNGNPSLSATQHFTITVVAVNRAPSLAIIPDQTVNEGELLTFRASATDPDLPAQSLAFSLGANAPGGASVDPVTGVFTWTPSEQQGPGTYFVSVFVADNGTPSLNDARGFLVTVLEVNRPPELDPIADRAVDVGTLLVFNVAFRDLDSPAQSLTLSLDPSAPVGAAISQDGLFTWTPSSAPSTNVIIVMVRDNGSPSLSATQRFAVTVRGFNRAPTLEAIPDQTVNEGELIIFTITATDPDQPGQTLTYTLGPGAPAGASLAPSTGVFTWTPNEFQGPETNLLSVLVTDNGSPPLAVAGNFRIVVREVNRAPVFEPITNQIVNIGSPLFFTLEANDPDIPLGELTFTMAPGTPAGATLTARGEFSWRPTAGQGPATNFITVFVTDSGVPPLKATNVVEIDVITGPPLVRPVLRNPSWTTNTFRASVEMQAGRRYSLEAADSPGQLLWRTVEAFQGRGAVDVMTDRNATNSNRIYRARAE